MQELFLTLMKNNGFNGDIMLNVTVCGLVVVFMVLLLLVAVIGIFGAITGKKGKAPKKDKKDPAKNISYANEDEQTIAVITAAVYSYYENNDLVKPVIRSIRPSAQKGAGRGVWQQAGMRQNMQPF